MIKEEVLTPWSVAYDREDRIVLNPDGLYSDETFQNAFVYRIYGPFYYNDVDKIYTCGLTILVDQDYNNVPIGFEGGGPLQQILSCTLSINGYNQSEINLFPGDKKNYYINLIKGINTITLRLKLGVNSGSTNTMYVDVKLQPLLVRQVFNLKSIPYPIQKLYLQDGIKKIFRIHFPNGEREDIINDQLLEESLSWTESICSSDSFELGMAESPQISFDCFGIENIRGKIIDCFIEIDLSSLDSSYQYLYGKTSPDVPFPFYSIPLGQFKINSCHRTDNEVGIRKVDAYTNELSLSNMQTGDILYNQIEEIKRDYFLQFYLNGYQYDYQLDMMKYILSNTLTSYDSLPIISEIDPSSDHSEKYEMEEDNTYYYRWRYRIGHYLEIPSTRSEEVESYDYGISLPTSPWTVMSDKENHIVVNPDGLYSDENFKNAFVYRIYGPFYKQEDKVYNCGLQMQSSRVYSDNPIAFRVGGGSKTISNHVALNGSPLAEVNRYQGEEMVLTHFDIQSGINFLTFSLSCTTDEVAEKAMYMDVILQPSPEPFPHPSFQDHLDIQLTLNLGYLEYEFEDVYERNGDNFEDMPSQGKKLPVTELYSFDNIWGGTIYQNRVDSIAKEISIYLELILDTYQNKEPGFDPNIIREELQQKVREAISGPQVSNIENKPIPDTTFWEPDTTFVKVTDGVSCILYPEFYNPNNVIGAVHSGLKRVRFPYAISFNMDYNVDNTGFRRILSANYSLNNKENIHLYHLDTNRYLPIPVRNNDITAIIKNDDYLTASLELNGLIGRYDRQGKLELISLKEQLQLADVVPWKVIYDPERRVLVNPEGTFTDNQTFFDAYVYKIPGPFYSSTKTGYNIAFTIEADIDCSIYLGYQMGLEKLYSETEVTVTIDSSIEDQSVSIPITNKEPGTVSAVKTNLFYLKKGTNTLYITIKSNTVENDYFVNIILQPLNHTHMDSQKYWKITSDPKKRIRRQDTWSFSIYGPFKEGEAYDFEIEYVDPVERFDSYYIWFDPNQPLKQLDYQYESSYNSINTGTVDGRNSIRGIVDLNPNVLNRIVRYTAYPKRSMSSDEFFTVKLTAPMSQQVPTEWSISSDPDHRIVENRNNYQYKIYGPIDAWKEYVCSFTISVSFPIPACYFRIDNFNPFGQNIIGYTTTVLLDVTFNDTKILFDSSSPGFSVHFTADLKPGLNIFTIRIRTAVPELPWPPSSYLQISLWPQYEDPKISSSILHGNGEVISSLSDYISIEWGEEPTKKYDRVSVTYEDVLGNSNFAYIQLYDSITNKPVDPDPESITTYLENYDPDDYQTYSLGWNTIIQENVFTEEVVQQILRTVGTQLKSFQYVPFDMELVGRPWVQAGDIVTIPVKELGEPKNIQSIVLRRTMNGIDFLKDSFEARGE